MSTWCVICGRKLLRPAAIKARRAAGNVLVAVGPVGPKCARGELLILGDPKTGTLREKRIRMLSVYRNPRPQSSVSQLDWIEQLFGEVD